MTKNEAIKAAYGEHWKDVQLIIDENGWFDMAYSEQVPNFDHLWDASDKKNAKIRPKELRGLETNNGWTRIESEEDLPKEGDLFWVMKKGYDYPLFEPMYHDDGEYWLINYTHYQPIEKPKPPIF
ncbi:hypothetical protein CMU14_13245 [Elizabethkingia anophelis]|nr:hypothetical protein [Elizabethkingia anophelis]